MRLVNKYLISEYHCSRTVSVFFRTGVNWFECLVDVCVPAVCAAVSVHERLMVSDGLTIKRWSLWRPLLPLRWLHPSCSLLYRCQNLWQRSSSPNSSGLPSFLSSCQSVSLPLPCSHWVPATAGLADQEPELPWQPVLSLSLDGSRLDCVSPSHPTPHNSYTNHIQPLSSPSAPFKRAFCSKGQFCHSFIRSIFICHSVFSLSQPGQGAGSECVAAESDEISLYGWCKWSHTVSFYLSGISFNASSAGRDQIPGEITQCSCPCSEEVDWCFAWEIRLLCMYTHEEADGSFNLWQDDLHFRQKY